MPLSLAIFTLAAIAATIWSARLDRLNAEANAEVRSRLRAYLTDRLLGIRGRP